MDFKEGNQPAWPDKKPVDQKLKTEFERVLAEHKTAMAQEKDIENADLAQIKPDELSNEDLQFFLKFMGAYFPGEDVTIHPNQRVAIVEELQYKKQVLDQELTEAHGGKISMDIYQSSSQYHLYSYLSHLITAQRNKPQGRNMDKLDEEIESLFE